MIWNRWLSHTPGAPGARERMQSPTSSPDQELIHSLHQWLDLCREAIAKGDPWGRSLIQVLTILRRLLDAHVAVVRVEWPLETFFRISTGNATSENWLSNDRQFVRLCDLLIATPRPMLIGEGLEGSEFVDPCLRSHFPNLSILTTAWSLPCGEIKFAFFSHLPGHFHPDQVALLDYFGSRLLGAPYADHEKDAICVAQRG